LEFSATLADATAPTTYSLALNTHGLLATLDADGMTVDLRDPAAADPTAVVGTISAPALQENTGPAVDPSEITVSLSTDARSLRPGETLLTYAINETWLHDPARSFPILLDPTTCLAYGYSSCPSIGSPGMTDTFVASGQTYHQVGWTVDRVGDSTYNDNYGQMQTLLWWNLPTLGDGEVIKNAQIFVDQYANLGSAGKYIHASLNASGFNMNTAWSNRPALYSIRTDDHGPCGSRHCALSWDVTALVRPWYKQAGSYASNFGVTLALADPTKGELQLDNYTDSVDAHHPKLQITYEPAGYSMVFDPALGPDFAPSTMVAGTTMHLPVIVTNNSKDVSGNYSWLSCSTTPTDCWSLGYRWYNAAGALDTVTGKLSIPAALAYGANTGSVPMNLPVAAPAGGAGQYTLRLDMVHHYNGLDLWASDAAFQSTYYARAKVSSSPSNVHWAGISPVEREEYPISVVKSIPSGGTTESVSMPDGSSAAVDLWTNNVTYTGSTGLGFADLGTNLGLNYYYSAADSASLPGVLGASDWYTTYDERIEPGTGGAQYAYRDSTDNLHPVSASGDGALTSGVAARVDRPRITWFDENNPIGTWSSPAPTLTTEQHSSGAYSYKIPATTTNAGTIISAYAAPVAVPVPTTAPRIFLNQYPAISLAVETSGTSGAGIGMKITDSTTSASRWFVYTIGADWTLPAGYYKKNIPAPDLHTWLPESGNVLADASAAFGSKISDTYFVDSIALMGRGGSGYAYYDAISFQGGSATLLDMPSWAGVAPTAESSDINPYDRSEWALQVNAAPFASSPQCLPCTIHAASLAAALTSNPYASWGWKKVGGSTLAASFHVYDTRHPSDSANWITYYAGPTPPPGAINPVQVSPTAPTNWTMVSRNLLEDSRQLFGYYNDSPAGDSLTGSLAPVPDPVTLDGFALLGGDTGYGLFDPVGIQTLPNVSGTGPGQVQGDDFLVTYANDEVHHFNADGILTSITDANGNATNLTHSYNYGLAYSSWKWSGSPYALTSVQAPSNGSAMADGTPGAIRQLSVTTSTSCDSLTGANNCLTFTENFGTAANHVTGRSAKFYTNSSLDLIAVAPARANGPCANGSSTGCPEFDYTAGAHLLSHVFDARPGKQATTIAYSGTTPTTITNPIGIRLQIFASGSSGAYVRARYQNADDVLANTVNDVDLTPNGGMVRAWAPIACTSSNCSTGYGVGPTDLLASYQTDGVGAYTSQIKYRTGQGSLSQPCTPDASATPAPGSCGNPIVSRTGTLAARAVDNYGDPIAGGETAWSQSPEQYASSMAAGSTDLYRTSYSYDSFGRVLDTVTPSLIEGSTYATQVKAAPGLDHYYRLGDTGSTAADALGTANGTIHGATTGAPDSLVSDADRAMSFNGSAYVSATTEAISGTFSVEALVNPSAMSSMAVAGSRGGGDCTFDIQLVPNPAKTGLMIHGDIGDGTKWLTISADAAFSAAAGQWYQVVYVVSPDGWSIYVNGRLLNSGRYDLNAGTPMLSDGTAARALNIGQTGSAPYPTYFSGSIDEFAIYKTALDLRTVAAHYAAVGATALDDAQTIFDTTGNPTQTFDNFLSNPGFERGFVDWNAAGATLGSGGTSASQNSATLSGGVSASQTIQLVAGQKVRLQVALAETTDANAQIALETDSGGGAFSAIASTPLQDPNPSSSWHAQAWDVAMPMATTGLLRITIKNTGAGSVSVDDVAIFTTYGKVTYQAGGLASSSIAISGATASSAATMITTLGYGVASGAVAPAIYPTSVTANTVTNGTGADQNVTTTSTVDPWGRTIASLDADGIGTATQYDTNQTDVLSNSDGLGHATTFTHDKLGNKLTVTPPNGASEQTTTVYDYENHILTLRPPADAGGHQSVSTSHYDAAGRLDYAISDSNGLAVRTNNTYDTYGNVLTSIADATGIAATTTNKYDLANNLVAKTLDPGSGAPTRTTTTFFDAAGTAAGSQAAIAPTGAAAPSCPGSTGLKCDTKMVFDINGHAIDSYDAYGVRTHNLYDLAGHAVRTIVNYVPGGNYTNSQNLVTDTIYDAASRPLAVTTYLVLPSANGGAGYPTLDSATAYVTSTTYDALGRAVSVVKPDNTWVHSVYTKGGRVDRVSRPGAAALVNDPNADSSVAWTKNVYDAAGRQVATLTNYNITGGAQLQMTTFESGTAEGVSGASSWAVATAASVTASSGSIASGSARSGFGSLNVTPGASSASGVSLALSGTFKAGHTYAATVYVRAGTSGQSWGLTLGASGDSSSSASGTAIDPTVFTPVTLTWQPASDHASGVAVAVLDAADAGNAAATIDDISVWDTGSAYSNVPTISVFDPDGRPVASILPGGLAGDAPMVTRTTYDATGRVTEVTVAAIAGAGTTGTTGAGANFATDTVYDGLGRKTYVTDPAGYVARATYDGLGDVISGTSDYVSGGIQSDQNVTALAAYDKLGEAIATCSANAVAHGCTSSNIATSSLAWQYTYDQMGHQTLAVPPHNTVLTPLDETATIYDSNSIRVSSVVSCAPGAPACTTSAGADRHTDLTYDALGRTTGSIAYSGTGTSTVKLNTTTTYDSLNRKLAARYVGAGQANPDTIEFAYDQLNRVTAMYEGTAAPGGGNAQIDAFSYNPDGTVLSRTDYAVSSTASTYTYDPVGRLTSATSPTFAAGVSTGFTWRLDGLLASRTWSTGPAALVYGYDAAKRPVTECNGAAGACTGAQIDIERGYDRVGNVMSETQILAGDHPSQDGTQSFTYDGLNRVLTSTLNAGQNYAVTKTYTYDSDGNRLTVTNNGVLTDTFVFDATDETISDTAAGLATNFAYDHFGNMTSQKVAGATATTSYGYDLADRLNSITQADGSIVGFTFDAAGRHATRTSTVGGVQTTIDTYSYLGSADSVIVDVSTQGAGYTLDAAIDAMGDRLASVTAAGLVWIVPDLHGNVAAQCDSTGTITDVFRYDAYGKIMGTSITGSVPSPWRFQGRILESVSGSDAYDFGARAYVPDLGTFTSLDSVAGSAQNPLTLNRYLYADANPATMVDPDGHCAYVDYNDNVKATPGPCSTTHAQSAGPKTAAPKTIPNCTDAITTNCIQTYDNRLPDPYTTTDQSGFTWLVTPIAGAKGEYSVEIPVIPGWVPIDGFGDYVRIDVALKVTGGFTPGEDVPITIHSDAKGMSIDTGMGSFDLIDPTKSGAVLSVATGHTESSGGWAQTSLSSSTGLPQGNAMYTTIDETFTQSFESGSKKNGITFGIEASTTFHVLHINQPQMDWRPVGVGLLVAAGAVLVVAQPETAPAVLYGECKVTGTC
jgi:RHS repeat-associated protein